MKYIILKGLDPILFSGKDSHSQVAYGLNDMAYGEGNELVAGGDCAIGISLSILEEDAHGCKVPYLNVVCSGDTNVKDIKSRGEEDAELIRAMLNNQ